MYGHSRHPFPNREDPGVAAGIRPLLQERILEYRYRAPFSICLRIDYVEAGGTNVLDFYVQPEDDEHCRIYTGVHRNDLDGDEHARRIFRSFGRYLGILLADLINVLNLDMFVIGGGVSSAWDAYAPNMFEELRARSLVYAATAPAD